MPDCVPEDQRGIASGLKSMLDMLGLVVAALVISRVLAAASGEFLRAGVIVVGAPAFAAGDGARRSRTRPGYETPSSRLSSTTAGGPVWHGSAAPRRVRPLARQPFLRVAGIYAVQAFAYYFVADVVRPADASTTVGNLMAIIGISVMWHLSGRPSPERWGRKPLALVRA